MVDGGEEDYRAAMNRIREIIDESILTAKFRDEPIFVDINGPFGSGKTRSGVCMVKAAYRGLFERFWIKACETPLFITAKNLVELRFGKSWNRDEDDDAQDELREQVMKSEFLLIDDLGRLPGYKGEVGYLESIIDHRWGEALSTVVTTSRSEGNYPARIEDLLKYFETIFFVAESFRGKSNV